MTTEKQTPSPHASRSSEPVVTINGYRLTEGQATTLRVAIQSFDAFSGDDAFGKELSAAYEARTRDIISLILAPPASPENHTDVALEQAACLIKDSFEDAGREVGGTFARQLAAEIMLLAAQPQTKSNAEIRWIEWTSGDFLPVPPEMRVTVLLRDGSIEGPAPAREFGGDESCWKHRGAAGDIVAYTSDLRFAAPPETRERGGD